MSSFPIYHRDDYWKIYFEVFRNGVKAGSGVYWRSYKHKSSATRAAKRQYDRTLDCLDGETLTYKWIVSQTNPWTEEKGVSE